MVPRSIGHYELVEQLGEGGMGVVWKARDNHLDRFVAIKLLSEKGTTTTGLARLVGEAKAASALNHPSIIHIYDAGECDGKPFIAMEYVAGRTLDAMIGRRGMRVNEVLKYGAQIADAMAVAHAAGIVHRDLKPANVMITESGNVKVLDFGLAKIAEPAGSSGSTVTAGELWKGGEKMAGTIPYLSPEQVEGRPLDIRSDIFSFGIMLYEMTCGANPFRRPTPTATVSAILAAEPQSLHELAPAVPQELERLIARCLRKDADRRLRSMADLAIGLKELKEESDSGQLPAHAPASPPRKPGPGLRWTLAASAVILFAAAILYWHIHKHRPAPARLEATPVTTYPGMEMQPTLSPDGGQLAFSWNGPNQQKSHIYVKAIGPGPPLQLTKEPADDIAPAWAPDGGSIAFLRAQGDGHYSIMLIPPLGGPERKVTDVFLPDMEWMPGPYVSWSPDSRQLVAADLTHEGGPIALFLVPVQMGNRIQLTFPPASILGDTCAALSGDGQKLAFCRSAHLGGWSIELYDVALDSNLSPQGDAQLLLGGLKFRLNGVAWTSKGDEMIVAAGRESSPESPLVRVPVPNPSRELGDELPVGAGVWPTISKNAARLAFSRETGGGEGIWRFDLSPGGRPIGAPSSVILSTRSDFAPRYSPDGKKIAFESSRGGNLEIWVCNSAGEECMQLTFIGGEYTGLPTWSPDGKHLALYSRVKDRSQIFLIGADGTGLRQVTSGDFNHFFPGWSRDGHWIYFSANSAETVQVWKMPAEGGSPVQVTRQGGFASRESPDGKFLYYTKTESTDTSLWRKRLPDGEESQIVASVHLHNFDVATDGVYFLDSTSSLKFINTNEKILTMATGVPQGYVGFSVAPDRRSLLLCVSKPQSSEIALINNFQ